MEAAEKMVALKKAYVKIILNTAKEAAARVIASERRAFQSQRDLWSVKNEGLRMLQRLKQRLDFKITEAELTATSQQRKIEVLEAQLNEAEDIVADLRIELKLMQNELEKVKKNRMQPSNGQIAKEPCQGNNIENKSHTYEPIAFGCSDSGRTKLMSDLNASINQDFLVNRCCNASEQMVPSSDSHLANSHSDNPDLASKVVRTKEPKMCTNGFTNRFPQQIYMFEGNLVGGKLHSGVVDDQPNISNSISVDGKEEITFSTPSPKTMNEDTMKNPVVLEEVMQIDSCTCGGQPVRVSRSLRRRKVLYRNTKARSPKYYVRQRINSLQPFSTLSCCQTILDSVKDNTISGVASIRPFYKADNMGAIKISAWLEENLQFRKCCSKDQADKIVTEGCRKRKLKHNDMLATSSEPCPCQLTKSDQPSFLSCCKNYLYPAKDSVKSNGDMVDVTDTAEKMKPSFHLDLAINKPIIVPNAAKEKEVIGESALLEHETETSKSLMVPICEMEPKMVAFSLADAEMVDAKASEADNGAPSQANNDRFFKYTFQRKRKKESLRSSHENLLLGSTP
ncbi:uncharacterized protein LOC131168683 [Malania oleifera]|uniref:uncharacterized protein LOC131168683 n=1 Tax=Malania oleifera TaxID=397392 RepID=UPI0025AE6EFD|nr:uncharacterized protein LOC131168683 [Malania oleifera]